MAKIEAFGFNHKILGGGTTATFREAIERELEAQANVALSGTRAGAGVRAPSLRASVATWDGKPKFTKKKVIESGNLGIRITASGRTENVVKFLMVDQGTKKGKRTSKTGTPHKFPGKRGLGIQARNKTTPKVLSSKSGRSDAQMFGSYGVGRAQSINHPGSTPRGFISEIVRRRQKPFESAMSRVFLRASAQVNRG